MHSPLVVRSGRTRRGDSRLLRTVLRCYKRREIERTKVQALQGPIFLSGAGGAGAIAVAGEPFDMAASFFLGGIVVADLNDLLLWDKLGCQADDCPPEMPALLVERAPEEHIEA